MPQCISDDNVTDARHYQYNACHLVSCVVGVVNDVIISLFQNTTNPDSAYYELFIIPKQVDPSSPDCKSPFLLVCLDDNGV